MAGEKTVATRARSVSRRSKTRSLSRSSGGSVAGRSRSKSPSAKPRKAKKPRSTSRKAPTKKSVSFKTAPSRSISQKRSKKVKRTPTPAASRTRSIYSRSASYRIAKVYRDSTGRMRSVKTGRYVAKKSKKITD